ncbi:diguanylate cyclase/phosphodiesterase [Citreicella sp. 357]|nr:diguanylate cyclase/phosphodiesterase [Citreicella sp. 357]
MMRTLVETLDCPVWLFTADGTVVAASPSARDLMPCLRTQIAEAGPLGCRIAAALNDLQAGEPSADIRVRVPGPDGAEIDLLGTIAWLAPGDRASGILAQLVPPTGPARQDHRLRLESDVSAARRQLARFHQMADNAPGAVYECVRTAGGRWAYTYHSAGLADLFGVSPEDIARDARSLFRHADATEIKGIVAEIGHAVQTGGTIERVLSVAHPTRGARAILLTTRPYPQPDGSTIWFGTMVDVTAQTTAERSAAEALNDAHERLNNLADNAPGALWEYRESVDGGQCFAYFSASLPDMVGVSATDLRGDCTSVLRHLPPEEVARVNQEFDVARSARSLFSCAFWLDHPEHGTRRMLLSAQPAELSGGAISWFVNLLDITRQEETEARAELAFEEVRDLHERLNSLAGNAPAALYEFLMDDSGHGTFPFFTGRMPALMGVPAEVIAADSQSVFDAIHPDDLPAVVAETERSRTSFQQFSHTFRTHGGTRWVTSTAQPVGIENGVVRWFGFMFDSTEQMQAEQRAAQASEDLRRAHARFLVMADNAPGAIVEFRITPTGKVRFLYCSPRLAELMGLPLDPLRSDGRTVYANVPPEDLDGVMAAVKDAMTGDGPGTFRHRVNHPLKGERWLRVSLSPNGQDSEGIIGFGSAIDVTDDVHRETELRRAHRLAEDMRRENERQAMHDGLTGLPNRRSYDREIESRRSAAQKAGTIIRVDLDYFKSVNDTLGHEAGDALLQRVADVLRARIGPEDFAARVGGDEFSILPDPSLPLEAVCALVETIRKQLAEPFFFEGRQCRFGASFGIARSDDMAADATDLPVFADAALYRAKNLGRNRLEIFTPELRQTILGERRLAIDLHEALERDEFEPWFQPQFSAQGEQLVGVETLLRWRCPDGRILTPESFMQVAEHLRIVPEIDRIMMLKARDALDFWQADGVFIPKISFNVSSGRMRDPDVVALGRQVATGKTRVTFELLESILVEEESDAFRFHLDLVRESGIDIEIDDFGSGHASIIGLMEISPTALKIDKRIVLPVARDVRSRNLVRAIIEIADTLGIATVAEGVETIEQVHILRDMGCDVLQGFHYAPALDMVTLARAARGWNTHAA